MLARSRSLMAPSDFAAGLDGATCDFVAAGLGAGAGFCPSPTLRVGLAGADVAGADLAGANLVGVGLATGRKASAGISSGGGTRGMGCVAGSRPQTYFRQLLS